MHSFAIRRGDRGQDLTVALHPGFASGINRCAQYKLQSANLLELLISIQSRCSLFDFGGCRLQGRFRPMAHAHMPARARAAFSALVLAMSTACSGPAWASPADYVLGPQDKLRIKVYDWRNNTGEAHEWTALTGEFSVGASGKIDLPLAGEIVAAGRTTSAVARDLGERLQQKVGLAQQPDASIEVVEYRPFYIVGTVQKAGAYPYRPDLTVLQAVGIAGGVPRTQRHERTRIRTPGHVGSRSAAHAGCRASGAARSAGAPRRGNRQCQRDRLLRRYRFASDEPADRSADT